MVSLKLPKPMTWIVAAVLAVASAACQSSPSADPPSDADPSAAASSSTASVQELCQSFYPFLAAVGFMANVEMLGILEGADAETIAQDLQSTAESVITTGAVLLPQAPDAISDQVAALIEAAVEVEQALLEGGAASEASELWERPEVAEAEAAVEDYYNESTCGPN